MRRGRYIVIEGGEGCGKDTQIERLQARFPDAVFTREPGGTPLGTTLRDILLHGTGGDIAVPTELFLFIADRAEHVDKVILPALRAGKDVISNRSWISSIAYQIYARDQFDWQPLIESAFKKIFAECPIDLALVLDLPPEVGFERMKAAGRVLDTMERLPLAAHERVRRGFLETAATLPHAVVIDAARTREEVWHDVERAVTDVISLP